MGAMIVGILMFATGSWMYIYTLGARPEIEAHDPRYASALYRSLPQQLCRSAWPVRASVLFLQTPPIMLRGTIQAMRVVCLVHFLAFAVFLGFVAHAFLV